MREATLEVLRLIQRFGREDMLGPLLALERFDRLCADPATLEGLASILASLVVGSGRSAMDAASRLVAVDANETSLARLRHALVFVSALDEAAAFGLEAGQHGMIDTWVWRVVRAGVAPRDLTPIGLDFEQRLLDVLVVAVMRLSHAALRGQSERGRGGVINVSSVAAFLPRGTYAAAKAWVNQFGKWAAAEYRPRGVTVTTVCPGFTKTEFHQRMQVTRGDGFMWLEPEVLVRKSL